MKPLELSGDFFASLGGMIRFGVRLTLISKVERYLATGCASAVGTVPDVAQRG